MKRRSIILSLICVAMMSFGKLSYGRTGGGFSGSYRHKIVLVPVKWKGSFRCEEKLHESGHAQNHECDLQFVDEATSEVWNVKSDPALIALHQKYGGPIKASVEALSSPRFLLGGSYIQIQKIDVVGDSQKPTNAPVAN